MASLRVAVWAQGQFTDRTHVTGPGISALALDAAGRLLARCRAAPGAAAELALTAGTVVAAESTLGGVPASTPVVAWGREETQATVVVQSTGEEVVAFQVANGDQPAHERWRVPGRVQGDNWPAVSGALLADLTGAGQRHIVHASAAPSGCARIVARSLAGEELWHHDFTAIPGGAPVWNVGGAVIWQAGCFTDATRQDVLVTVRRSMMHSEETSLLSGTDGHELWHRDRQVSNRGVGGTPFAIADYDGDGREEALFTQGNTLTCLGTLPGAAQGGVRWTFALPATVGPPAIAAVDGSGEAVILLVGADGYVYAVR